MSLPSICTAVDRGFDGDPRRQNKLPGSRSTKEKSAQVEASLFIIALGCPPLQVTVANEGL